MDFLYYLALGIILLAGTYPMHHLAEWSMNKGSGFSGAWAFVGGVVGFALCAGFGALSIGAAIGSLGN